MNSLKIIPYTYASTRRLPKEKNSHLQESMKSDTRVHETFDTDQPAARTEVESKQCEYKDQSENQVQGIKRFSGKRDSESIFENGQLKKARSRSTTPSPDRSIDVNNDAVTTSTKPLVYHSINEEPFSFDVTQDTEHILTSSINKIPNRDNSKTAYVDHNGKSKEEEDYHPSAWYRLGPITSNLSQSCTYVAQVSNDKREFHNIIGKEQIDNKMCYLVDWTPSLVPY
ncbi:predicted protein [Sclerotinia sclerotiorum 1980 UF-70]|uniref:Uncharacterized protein n=1 Tax=Sclerotinia sclerotiorum (strain ATCC 18683 / 1980 / Ss-1) TaxID=665079 RepID=A7EW24_SCLS1|nr:predicted protein [Sclerotinia sclerotiorum 1980 UF-70]EDN93666.1 predicted protein [Sclerotinia sclerotiorum 1980 UF-70]